MIKKLYILFILIIFGGMTANVSSQKITNVRFQPFGQDIHVHYDLNGLSFDSYSLLSLYVSTNGGESFQGPMMYVGGDIGKVETNGSKTIIWRASQESGNMNGQIVFEIRGDVIKEKIKAENLLFYNVSGSSYAGLMYGKVARWGGFLRLKTDLSFDNASYLCDDKGIINYPGDYKLDKSVRRSRLGITGGALYRTSSWLYLYAGAGYGFRRLMWHAQTLDKEDEPSGEIWAVNNDHSAEGVELEAGGILRYKRWGLSVGMNLIDFRFVEVNGGIGFFF